MHPCIATRAAGKGLDMIRYTCIKCGVELESPSSMAGRKDTCPLCGTACTVPRVVRRSRRVVVIVACSIGTVFIITVAVLLFGSIRDKNRQPSENGDPKTPRAVLGPEGPADDGARKSPPTVLAPAELTVHGVRWGPGDRWQIWASTTWVDGKKTEVWLKPEPVKAEYNEWLFVELGTVIPQGQSGDWTVNKLQYVLQEDGATPATYACLAIVHPDIRRQGTNFIDAIVAKDLSQGKRKFCTVGRTVVEAFDAAGFHGVGPGDKLTFTLAFPSDVPSGHTMRIKPEQKASSEASQPALR